MAGLRAARRRRDRGAAAVEFALVAPLLFIVLFGIIDYGIWFADSISARQAVRDGARRGSVEQFGTCGSGGDLASLACTVKSGMGQISGTSYVRVVIATDPLSDSVSPITTTGAWKVGATLRVCAITQHTSLLPFVPFPAGGFAKTRVDIPIEVAGAGAPTRVGYAGDALPSGVDWPSWCP
jgi:Flp pilus assembly protein TadG